MKKLNKKQENLILNFIKNNKSAPTYLSCDQIDPDGSIENLNNYESCWSDIEKFYFDSVMKQNLHHQIWYSVTNQEEKEIEERKKHELSQKEIDSRIKSYTKWKLEYLPKFSKIK